MVDTVTLPHDALALAALTPAAGWSPLSAPAVNPAKTAMEYRQMMRRAWNRIAGRPSTARQGAETYQAWCDRLGATPCAAIQVPAPDVDVTADYEEQRNAKRLLHAMATAFANGVTS